MPEQTAGGLKFCKDCKWAVDIDNHYWCDHEAVARIDVVDGKRKLVECHIARAAESLCGLSGRRWEARDG